jgi:hypothetical protein
LRKRGAAAFDQPIGVHHDHLAACERQLMLGAASIWERAQRRSWLEFDRTRARRPEDDRRQVAGGGHRQASRLGVEHGVRCGRHGTFAHRLDVAIDELERAGRRVALQRVRVQGETHLPHQCGGPHPVSDDVADCDPDQPVR